MKNNPLDHYRKVMLPAIESELRLTISHTDSQWQRYYGMMRYHLGWEDKDWQPVSSRSGKRVRPMLCLLAAEAISADWKTALPAAAAVELLHNFSLIHDDIEDNSDTRRGRSTVWSIWGIPQAINTGDGMYAAAFQAMTQLEIDSPRLAEVYKVFTRASTQLTMGQHLDMLFEDDTTTTLDDYAIMIRGKTAALLSASTELGAIVAGADVDARACLAKFGQRLGMAFQVVDDYLGIWGDPKHTGKSAASDLFARKKSYPVIYASQNSDNFAAYYQQPNIDIDHTIDILETSGAKQKTINQAEKYTSLALESLAQSGLEGEAVLALEELLSQLVQRQS